MKHTHKINNIDGLCNGKRSTCHISDGSYKKRYEMRIEIFVAHTDTTMFAVRD